MGCDIHVVVEQRHEGVWVGVHDCPTIQGRGSDGGRVYHWHDIEDRNYRRFAMLAGVRGEGPEPRGMPPDASALAEMRYSHWAGDGHSFSWASVYELIPVLMETSGDKDREELARALFAGQRVAGEYITYRWLGVGDSVDPEDVRIVYWFDN